MEPWGTLCSTIKLAVAVKREDTASRAPRRRRQKVHEPRRLLRAKVEALVSSLGIGKAAEDRRLLVRVHDSEEPAAPSPISSALLGGLKAAMGALPRQALGEVLLELLRALVGDDLRRRI